MIVDGNANSETNFVITTGILLSAKNLLKISAPIKIKKIIAVNRVVSFKEFKKSFQLNRRVTTANKNAPNAPIPPASVGVKNSK